MWQLIKCKLGFHKIGNWIPAVGGREVRKCIHCDKVLKERSVMNQVGLPKRPPLPKGKESDKWFK